MKLSLLIGTLSAASVMASPAATYIDKSRLNRAFKDVSVTATGTADADASSETFKVACVECPCDGFSGSCQCVFQGCCCDWTIPSQPPATGWRAASEGPFESSV
ncbi:hypothetical protein ACEQ8H_005712 [Pleosporales sp. CAS-2024a]